MNVCVHSNQGTLHSGVGQNNSFSSIKHDQSIPPEFAQATWCAVVRILNGQKDSALKPLVWISTHITGLGTRHGINKDI